MAWIYVFAGRGLVGVTRRCRGVFAGLVAATLFGCGGGGGGDSDAASGAGGGGAAPDVASFSGTYTLKLGSAVVGSFMVDQAASITTCAIETDGVCAAELTPPATAGSAAAFKLKNEAALTTISGTIATNGSVSGQLAKANGSVEQLTGAKVSTNFADCQQPYRRVNGQCVPPSSGVVLIPQIGWSLHLSQQGRTYVMQMCYVSMAHCVSISPEIFVSHEDWADEETPEIWAYAQSVAKAYGEMIVRLWKAETVPPAAQLYQTFRNAVDPDVQTGSRNAVATAGAAFTAAGYPAATGAPTSGPRGTVPTAESACASLAYPGDTSEPQIYLYDKIAQLDACLYRATNNSDYMTDGNRQCRILDGLLKATTGTFKPMFCNGEQLKS